MKINEVWVEVVNERKKGVAVENAVYRYRRSGYQRKGIPEVSETTAIRTPPQVKMTRSCGSNQHDSTSCAERKDRGGKKGRKKNVSGRAKFDRLECGKVGGKTVVVAAKSGDIGWQHRNNCRQGQMSRQCVVG